MKRYQVKTSHSLIRIAQDLKDGEEICLNKGYYKINGTYVYIAMTLVGTKMKDNKMIWHFIAKKVPEQLRTDIMISVNRLTHELGL